MSYNTLYFDPDSLYYKDSISFMNNIKEFFKIAKFVNHVNFGGMNYE